MNILIIDRNQLLNGLIELGTVRGHNIIPIGPNLLPNMQLPRCDICLSWVDNPLTLGLASKHGMPLLCIQHGYWQTITYRQDNIKASAAHYFVYSKLDKFLVEEAKGKATIVGYPWWETKPVKPETSLPEKYLLYIPRHGNGGTAFADPVLTKQMMLQAKTLADFYGLPLVIKQFTNVGGVESIPGAINIYSKPNYDPNRLGNMLWLIKNATKVYIPVEQSASKMYELRSLADYYYENKPASKAILNYMEVNYGKNSNCGNGN